MRFFKAFICAVAGHKVNVGSEERSQTCGRCGDTVDCCEEFGHLFEDEKYGFDTRTCKRCDLVEIRCSKCGGLGKIYEKGIGDICSRCDGKGSVPFCDTCAAKGQPLMCGSCAYNGGGGTVTCEVCHGSGHKNSCVCETCGGKKWLPQNEPTKT